MTRLTDCRVIDLPEYRDDRGALIPMDGLVDVPFVPVRAFILRDLADGASRGKHAHRVSDEFVVPVSGAVTVTLFDGRHEERYRLDSARRGVFLPPMIWIELAEFTADAVVLALASRHYDQSEYITDRAAFVTEKGN